MSSKEEDELESYLQRRALLRANSSYQAHGSYLTHGPYPAHPERLEPPPELDRIVLRKARLALQNRQPQEEQVKEVYAPPPVVLPPAYTRPPHRARWYAPASVAATMLVCLTVLVDIGAHALRGDGAVPATQLHGVGSAEPAAVQASVPVLAKVTDESSDPLPEVVIRAARLTTHPVSGAPHSAGPASR
jgi:hypothetical protein